MIGKTLAHYELEGRLGEGGSGVVYRGRDLRLDRVVAIKVLADALRDDELAWARLLREARLASQLNHPHIAAIYDLGEEEGCAYIAMEYVEGLPLADLIPDGGMPVEQVERYAAQIAGALAFAHDHGTIHGDLKGTNIVITPDGEIKLLDFGLGRRIPRSGATEVSSSSLGLSEAGATAGTLPFLAPEVLRGGPTTAQSDVWSFGVLIYQMATGELPFRGATGIDLSVEIMVGTPPEMAGMPEPLQSLVRRCLEKDPAARIAQANELVRALEGSTAKSGPGPSAPVSDANPDPLLPFPTPAEMPVRQHRRTKWVAASTTAVFLILGGIYARHVWRARPAAPSVPVAPSVAIAKVQKPAGMADPNVKVWVNTDSGTYHCAGTRWYGKTQTGEYMTQKQAQLKGYHPAAKHACM